MFKIKIKKAVYRVKYLEIITSDKIYYRIYSEIYKDLSKKKNPTYGIEIASIIDNKSDYLSSFSKNPKDAMDFCEYLTENKVNVDDLSNASLNFLALKFNKEGF